MLNIHEQCICLSYDIIADQYPSMIYPNKVNTYLLNSVKCFIMNDEDSNPPNPPPQKKHPSTSFSRGKT